MVQVHQQSPLLRGRLVAGLAGLALLATAGCQDAPSRVLEPETPQQSILSDPGPAQPAQGPGANWPQEEQFRQLSAEVPGGYGGHYYDDQGNMVVWATDIAAARTAEAHLRGRNAENARFIRGANGAIRYRAGQYTFEELREWRDRLFPLVLSLENTLWIDLDEATNRVRVGIVPQGAGQARAAIARMLREQGIPRGAVSIDEEEAINTDPAPAASSSTGELTEVMRPIKAGIQVAYYDNEGLQQGCTIGWVAHYTTTPVAVTASHCSYTWAGLDYGTYYQSGDPAVIGSEWKDQPWWWCDDPGGNRCIAADANLINVTSHTPAFNQIAKPIFGGSVVIDTSSPTFSVVGEVPASYVGMPVSKVGRSSGWSNGSVDKTCRHYRKWGSDQVTVCMDRATYNSDGGDSGAPVFVILSNGTDVLMAGIHRGRVAFSIGGLAWRRGFSPMSQVRVAFPLLEQLFQ